MPIYLSRSIPAVLSKTESGEHKVKITGIMVSEEAGEGTRQAIHAVEWAADMAMKSKDGTADVRDDVN